MIPFMDLKAIHEPLYEDILAAWTDILKNATFVGGKYVAEFENDFARYIGVDSCVGVSSGTDALRLALMAMDVGPGDEVITTPNTFYATVEAIQQTGATTKFVDVHTLSGTMNAGLLESAITERTKAIVPVHLYGQACDMKSIKRVAKKKNLLILEDACQAHGAFQGGERVGTFGDMAAFSFYPGKNLGACGDGGAVVTNNPTFAERVAALRDHGQINKGSHSVNGYTARLDACQAAALTLKLQYLDVWNLGRRSVAEQYAFYLAKTPNLYLPREATGNFHVWHLYILRTVKRDWLRHRLAQQNIGTGIHYPVPCHQAQAAENLGYAADDFPTARRWSEEGLSLPMYPTMTDNEVDTVCTTIQKIMGES